MFALPGELEIVLATSSWLGRRLQQHRATREKAGGPRERASSIVLPGGHVLDLARSRWAGPLDARELDYCLSHDIPIAYDCAQAGWVTQACRHQETLVDDRALVDETTPISTASAVAARPAETLDAQRARAIVRLRSQRLASARGQTLEQRAAAVGAITEAIAEQVRDFKAGHGLRAANALHFALHAIRHQELTESPTQTPEAGEFTFRAWSEADVSVYRRMLDNPRLWEYMPEPLPTPLTEAAALALIGMASVEGHQEGLAVEHAGRPVGQCLLRFDEPYAGPGSSPGQAPGSSPGQAPASSRVPARLPMRGPAVRAAEVAYWLDEEHWGKGWMTRILPAFLARGMRSHPIDVVYAWIREDHAASRRVAEAAGFERDTFAFERELAEATRRAGFVRYATYRPAWVGRP